ncbi:hypothetical protein [Saccharopolyspora elongata]|uniref:Uncharacterized protein n=1 Tax=Saccharopolyspora elongata TaxID=2530387 RepID=A0A4R4Y196_9PSEU|nr:hypothetical protein [Saccharopolyspora elongata]TDD37184.1 hypothetical protein E1288_40825 [Saccharopolyspora elongata]
MFPLWVNGPINAGSQHRITRDGFRTVLVMVPHLVAGTRLMDLLPLIESDHRVQTVFTVPETLATWHGTADFLRAQGGLVIPWQQALQYEFDLVLDASRSDTPAARGPMLVTPHGAGALKSRLRPRKGGQTALPTHGLVRENLISQGAVVPAALVLAHTDELEVLRSSCPEALPAAVVAGDICLDRMWASARNRLRYRRALGVDDGRWLVVVSSTWSTESLFGQVPGLFQQLLDELPSERYVVAAVLHPNIWTVHGRRQVRAWLSSCTERGMLVMPPEEGWRAAMIAADVLIGDHGSTTQYGAALGAPILLGSFPEANIRPGSPAAELARMAPRLDCNRSLRSQLEDTAARWDRARVAEVMTDRLTSHPGGASAILRRSMYELMGIPEPPCPAPIAPVPIPVPIRAALSIEVPE